MKKIITTIFLLLLTTNALADHAWGTFHWKRIDSNPVKIDIIDSVSYSWYDELAATVVKWNESSVLDLTITYSETDDVTRQICPATLNAIRACTYNWGQTGWLGLATIGLDSTGHINTSTTRVNEYYSSYWTSQSLRNHVMCQEVGHGFGLGHTSEDGSSQQTCMDYSSSVYSQWPNIHDYQMLEMIYNHIDSGGGDSGGSGNTCKGNDKNCDGIPDKGGKGGKSRFDGEVIPPMGVRVSGNDHSNLELWVAPREGGGLWIHHIWIAE